MVFWAIDSSKIASIGHSSKIGSIGVIFHITVSEYLPMVNSMSRIKKSLIVAVVFLIVKSCFLGVGLEKY